MLTDDLDSSAVSVWKSSIRGRWKSYCTRMRCITKSCSGSAHSRGTAVLNTAAVVFFFFFSFLYGSNKKQNFHDQNEITPLLKWSENVQQWNNLKCVSKQTAFLHTGLSMLSLVHQTGQTSQLCWQTTPPHSHCLMFLRHTHELWKDVYRPRLSWCLKSSGTLPVLILSCTNLLLCLLPWRLLNISPFPLQSWGWCGVSLCPSSLTLSSSFSM